MAVVFDWKSGLLYFQVCLPHATVLVLIVLLLILSEAIPKQES